MSSLSKSRCCTMDYTIFPLPFDMPRPPHTHLALYADDTTLLSQSWRPGSISHCNDPTQILHCMETPIKYPQNWNRSIFQAPPPSPFLDPLQIHDIFVPWPSAVSYLDLALDSQLLYTQHLHTAVNKATAVLSNISPHLARDSTLTKSSKSTIYKLLILSILTYAAPVCSSICPSNYLRL
jgi:hypothetical protein